MNKTFKKKLIPKNKVGNVINKIINVTQTPRRWLNNKIRSLGVNSESELLRNIAMGITLPGALADAAIARVNTGITELYPNWLDEKAKDQVGKGRPVWTVDKEFNIARYYDKDGNLLITSPAGTGLVEGDKVKEGDNRTPEGTYTLSAPQKGSDKKGGTISFGPYFYRTNHRNSNSGKASGIGLHGTGFPILNGSNVSHGCIRIDNRDIRKFYETAPRNGANTKIIITDK